MVLSVEDSTFLVEHLFRCGQNYFYNHLASKVSESFSTRIFFLWGAMKISMYSNNPHIIDDLKMAVTEYIPNVNRTILNTVLGNTVRRVNKCLETGGRHLEPLGTVRPIYRTGTPLPSKHPILCLFSTNIRTEYFKHAASSPFLSFQNAVYFIMLPCLVPVLFTF
jgi:hypothetical protein